MFNPGDKVSFLSEPRNGVVTSVISSEMVNVMIGEGFEIPVPVSDLVKVDGGAVADIEKISVPGPADTGRKDETIRSVLRFSRKPERPEAGEVDLHIGELVDDYAGLSNRRILDIQLGHFTAKLEEAIANRKRKIVFIHGVGEGVLKQELRRILDGYEQVTYHDAPFRKYGFGATEVLIG